MLLKGEGGDLTGLAQSQHIAHWVNHGACMYVCSGPVMSHPCRLILEGISVVMVDIVIGIAPGQRNLGIIFPVASLERESCYMVKCSPHTYPISSPLQSIFIVEGWHCHSVALTGCLAIILPLFIVHRWL